jgi:hypothetical protein
MTKVFATLATSVDGYITGPNPGPDQPLGDGGAELVGRRRSASNRAAVRAHPASPA